MALPHPAQAEQPIPMRHQRGAPACGFVHGTPVVAVRRTQCLPFGLWVAEQSNGSFSLSLSKREQDVSRARQPESLRDNAG